MSPFETVQKKVKEVAGLLETVAKCDERLKDLVKNREAVETEIAKAREVCDTPVEQAAELFQRKNGELQVIGSRIARGERDLERAKDALRSGCSNLADAIEAVAAAEYDKGVETIRTVVNDFVYFKAEVETILRNVPVLSRISNYSTTGSVARMYHLADADSVEVAGQLLQLVAQVRSAGSFRALIIATYLNTSRYRG